MDEPITLPNRASELIKLALEDLAKIEASPDYFVDMSLWHMPAATAENRGYVTPVPETASCVVCLAGAVMANTLGAPQHLNCAPSSFAWEHNRKLEALDRFRTGMVTRGLDAMQAVDAAGEPWRDDRLADVPDQVGITRYEVDPAQFRADLERLAAVLEFLGL